MRSMSDGIPVKPKNQQELWDKLYVMKQLADVSVRTPRPNENDLMRKLDSVTAQYAQRAFRENLQLKEQYQPVPSNEE